MWSPADIVWMADSGGSDQDLAWIAEWIYGRVSRVEFDVPGACLVDLGTETTSLELRAMMVGLKTTLGRIHQERMGRDLVYQSLGRFDQQTTTKLHRDGGPDQSLLMLGYEPSEVESELAMADYSQCAYDRGLSPEAFLAVHNPMFASGEDVLRPYTWKVDGFSNRHAQIVVINNSIAPFSAHGGTWQGVLHTATIMNPSGESRRVVNSSMLVPLPKGAAGPVREREVEDFRNTTIVRRKGYDQPARDDDV
jgi:hypothetical protein